LIYNLLQFAAQFFSKKLKKSSHSFRNTSPKNCFNKDYGTLAVSRISQEGFYCSLLMAGFFEPARPYLRRFEIYRR
jgi:hypothetical protein